MAGGELAEAFVETWEKGGGEVWGNCQRPCKQTAHLTCQPMEPACILEAMGNH